MYSLERNARFMCFFGVGRVSSVAITPAGCRAVSTGGDRVCDVLRAEGGTAPVGLPHTEGR